MAKVLNFCAVQSDLPGIYDVIAEKAPVAWHWLAENRGMDGPRVARAETISEIPDPFLTRLNEIVAVLPGRTFVPRMTALKAGGTRYTLDPYCVGESLWFQVMPPLEQHKIIRECRLFMVGTDPMLKKALAAAERYFKREGVRPLLYGQPTQATWVLPGAIALAAQGWRLNNLGERAPEGSDLFLPPTGPVP